MESVYKYDPGDFVAVPFLADDLEAFYNLHSKYVKSKAIDDKMALKSHGRTLYFTLKHEVLGGTISEELSGELNEYLGGLIDD